MSSLQRRLRSWSIFIQSLSQSCSGKLFSDAGHYVMVRKRPKYVMKIFPAQIYRWNWRENNMQSVRLGMWLYNKYVLTQTNAAVAIAKMHCIAFGITGKPQKGSDRNGIWHCACSLMTNCLVIEELNDAFHECLSRR